MYDYRGLITASGCRVQLNEPMKKHTSFKIGGPADAFIYIENEASLVNTLSLLKTEKIPFFVMGNGSNLLVSDKGIRGAVIKLAGKFENIQLTGECEVACGAAVMLPRLCTFAQRNFLTGLEFGSGIPGTIGGAICMNAGAYGGEMKDVVALVQHINVHTLHEGSRAGEDLGFEYRSSSYGTGSDIITDVKLKLSYSKDVDIAAKMQGNLHKRKSSQPLTHPNAGSIFKRPKGNFAARLIDECGLKGLTIGGAMVSEKHAGFIINTGDAVCEDVLCLIEKIKETVYKKTGIMLECEVKIVGGTH